MVETDFCTHALIILWFGYTTASIFQSSLYKIILFSWINLIFSFRPLPLNKSKTLSRKERQFRIEQREEDGSVRGSYGYVDNRGKVHLTKYTASIAEGFKVEQVPSY